MVVSGEEYRYLIMFEGKFYSDMGLTNLHNDKFVAVGSSLYGVPRWTIFSPFI